MKRTFALAGLSLLMLAGCGNKNIDTAKVRAAMSSLDGGQKAILEQGLTDIDGGKYKDAMPYLRKVAFTAKLNSDQNTILKDTIDKVQKKIDKGE